jgi:hypothetical protein
LPICASDFGRGSLVFKGHRFLKFEVQRIGERKSAINDVKTASATRALDLSEMTGSVISRYEMYLVAEDLLLEDFPEPENKDEVNSKLLTKLGFHNR